MLMLLFPEKTTSKVFSFVHELTEITHVYNANKVERD